MAAMAPPAKIEKPAATAMTLERAKPLRPFLRRGITEPKGDISHLHPQTAQTPPSLFDDIKPSPAAFASTGLIKKKSNLPAFQIPKFSVKSSPIQKDIGPACTHRVRPSIDASKGAGQIGNGLPTTVQAAQRTRGLRRKGSTMFTSSGSSGSISISDAKGLSPITPTKPNGKSRLVCQPDRTDRYSFIWLSSAHTGPCNAHNWVLSLRRVLINTEHKHLSTCAYPSG